jgi:hypothetical protein
MAQMNTQHRLGDLLVESGVISERQLGQALAEQLSGQERIGETLLRLGFLERNQLVAALAEQNVRRFVGALGISMIAFYPGLAAAGSARSQMTVSATVVSVATSAVAMASAASPGGTGAAAVQLACNAGGVARVGIERGSFTTAPPAAGAALGPDDLPSSYVMTWRSRTPSVVPCTSSPQAILAPVEAAAKAQPSVPGQQALNVVITY